MYFIGTGKRRPAIPLRMTAQGRTMRALRGHETDERFFASLRMTAKVKGDGWQAQNDMAAGMHTLG
jgi:hypothetical protein